MTLTESDRDEIEAGAKTNAAETYRGPLLGLVAEVAAAAPDCA